MAFNGKDAASKRIVVTILRFFDLLFETDILSNKVSVLIKKKCQASTHSPVSVIERMDTKEVTDISRNQN